MHETIHEQFPSGNFPAALPHCRTAGAPTATDAPGPVHKHRLPLARFAPGMVFLGKRLRMAATANARSREEVIR